jgi:hypothetical protein
VNPKIFLFAMALVSLACAKHASVSESQCTAGDWQTIGYRDGSAGTRSTRLLAHQDACVQHGVIPDRDEYMAGWTHGIAEFCNPTNGFAVGHSGRRHANICPVDQRQDFQKAYKEGRSLYLATAAVRDLERKISRKTIRLEAVKEEIVTTLAAQLNPLLIPSVRIELLAKVRRLNDEEQRLTAEIPILEEKLALKSNELEALDRSMAALSF